MAESNTTKKRRLRNAESIRERALKAQEEASKPGRSDIIRQRTSTVTSWPVRLVARIFSVAPLKWLRKPLRFIGRLLFPSYFRNSWKELRLVAWPSRRQTRQLTFAVLLFALAFGGVVFLVDLGLDKLFKQVLLK